MKERPSRIVVFNVFGHRNTGDAMLLESLIDLMHGARPGDPIVGVAFDVESERRWMPDIEWHERIGNAQRGALRRVKQMLSLMVMICLAVTRHAYFLRALLPPDQRRAIEALKEADLAISCPGGYLEDSNQAYYLNILQILIAARLCDDVVLAPQSFGPIRSAFGRKLLWLSLKRVQAIFPRESAALDFVRSGMGADYASIEPKVHLSGDLAFWYRRGADPNGTSGEWARLGVDPNRPIFGTTIVDWGFPHHSDPAAARANYLDSLSELIRHVEAKGHQVVIFNQVSYDLPFAEVLAARHPGIIVDRFDRDCGAFAGMIAQCDVFLGTRFHSCIFGLIGSAPTGAIAYLPKTRGIMRDLGLEDFVVDIDDVTGNSLVALYDRLAADRAKASADVHQAVGIYRADRATFEAYLRNSRRSVG